VFAGVRPNAFSGRGDFPYQRGFDHRYGLLGGAYEGGVRSAVLIRGSGLKAGVLTPESARAPSITLCVTAWTFN
jgi:hypothetical protein